MGLTSCAELSPQTASSVHTNNLSTSSINEVPASSEKDLLEEPWGDARATGYVAHAEIDGVDIWCGFSKEAEIQALKKVKTLSCKPTSNPGIKYCGRVVAGKSFTTYIPFLGRHTVHNKVAIFKLNNIFITEWHKQDGSNYIQILSQELSQVFEEQGLQWGDRKDMFRTSKANLTYVK